MKLALLLPLASSSSVLAAVVIALPIGTGRYAAAFLLGLVQAGAIVLAARREDREPDPLPIQYYGKEIRGYDARSRVTALPAGWEIRETAEPIPPYVPDKRTEARLLNLLLNETGAGKRIGREGVALGYRLLGRYGISRAEAGRLRDYVAVKVGYRTIDGTVYLARRKALDFLARMKAKGAW